MSWLQDVRMSENAMVVLNIAVCAAGVVGLVAQLRSCHDIDAKMRADDSAKAVEHAKARPAIFEACKSSCGERGVHKVNEAECECK